MVFRKWMCIGVLVAHGIANAQWVDHFDDICGLDQWLDIQVEEGWNIQALEEHNISITHPGYFMMMPYTVTWYADYRGPLFYRYAYDDFILTGNISVSNRDEDDVPGSAYSLGGLMVRNPKSLTNGSAGWIPGEEDYVFLSIGSGSSFHPSCPGCPAPHFEVKSTINSNSNLNLSPVDTTVADIRMVRLHPYVLVLYRHPGQDWIVHRRYHRADLQDTVQVGMVTYTDWDKGSTYTMPFHNSHVLNEDLDPDPSNDPALPFAPDIITRYDFLELSSTTMPPAWSGLNLTDPNQVTDAQILQLYGNSIPVPEPPTEKIWLGRNSASWSESANWLPAGVPAPDDTVRINSCACPEVYNLEISSGTVAVAGLHVMESAIVVIPAGATLEIMGPLINEGTITIHGQLLIHGATGTPASNYGTLDCRAGGLIHVLD